MSKTIKTVSIAVVALVLIYFGYEVLKDWLNPCEGIFQQTAEPQKLLHRARKSE